MLPLLSIVIANYNYGRFLEEAILSVIKQDVMNEVELIIVDGKSKDESVGIIKKYERYISWWISEADGGQSEAFNKGFRHSSGKYLTWLNADDVMPAGCLKKVLSELRTHPTYDWFTANHFRFLQSTKEIIQVDWGPNWYPSFIQSPSSPLVIFGPATFFSKNIYDKVGGIDESLHLVMDTDLWIRFMMSGVKQRRINCFCWAFRMHESSKTAEYEGHERKDKTICGPELTLEHNRIVDRSSYRPRFVTRLLGLFFRIIDGSLVVREVLRMRLKGRFFNSKEGVVL